MNFFKTFLASLLALIVGTVLMFFIWIGVLFAMLSSVESHTGVKPNSVVCIDLNEDIIDSPSTNPFAGIDPLTFEMRGQITLLDALRAIEYAAQDARVSGICLNMTGEGVTSFAILEELRSALVEFKKSGKFIVAYNESYSQPTYYLSSVADKVYIQPEGSFMWTGLSSDILFYKGLLDKLDIKAEILRPTQCRYKSAVEPYFLTQMSPENRQQMQTLMSDMWGVMVNGISEARGISPDRLNEYADQLSVYLPDEALKAGLVDGVIYEDELQGRMREISPADKDYETISFGEYVYDAKAHINNVSTNQVAIAYANGGIIDGESTETEVGGKTLAATLRSLREDKAVRAVVLRVNSPGGSALASDVVWREMELLKAQKPVVVSMGSYAASGGYYISVPADVIMADKSSITGSIGVFGMMFDAKDALKNKLGVTVDGVATNPSASFTPFAPLNSNQRAMLMRSVDKIYGAFTSKVAAGRNLPLERVMELAEGRVWSGERAVQLGLVDGNGSLTEAVAVAAEKAGVAGDYRITEAVEPMSGLFAVLSSFAARVESRSLRSELGVVYSQYKNTVSVLNHEGVLMYCPYNITIN